MAKKKGKGKPRGLVSTKDLGARIGKTGIAEAKELQQQGYSRDVLSYAARTIPKIPANVERVIASMSKTEQEKFRKAFLKDALANKVPF